MYGKVYLIGAGPGAADLITEKGGKILKSADIILYDKLASPQLLAICKKGAEKIFVGKEAGKHHVKQEDTIKIMLEKAKDGKTVARLKGGDPYIFGRGSEEAIELVENGIDFEIVPGITAASGATAYAGIPLTHRGLVTQCVLLTAHEAPGKEDSQIEWEKLAKMKHTTIVIYMGARLLPKITETLLGNGMPADTPAAIVQNGTMPNQRSFSGTLARLPEIASDNALKPPLISIIGPTAAMREEINWFEKKPLFGKRIVVTRAKDQAQTTYDKLEALGAEPLAFPVIRTELTVPDLDIREMFNNIIYDWALFSSENGVRYFFEALQLQNLDARIIGKTKIAAIGSGTARKLNSFGIFPDFIPSKFTSESLVEELAELEHFIGKKYLRVKGYFKQDPLTDKIREKGGAVDTIEVYDLAAEVPDETLADDLTENGADSVMFTSTSTVHNFFAALGDEKAREILASALPLSIGPVTASALEELGIKNFISSKVHTIDGMLETLLEHWK